MSIIFNKIYYSITDSTVIQIIIIQEYKYKIIINYGTYYMDIFSIYQTKEINHINTIPKYLLLLFDLIFDYHSTFQDIYYQLNISLKNYSNEDSKNIKIGNLSIKYNNLLNDYNIIINKSQIKYNNLVTESEIKYNNLLNDYNTLKNESEIKYNNLLSDYNTLKNESKIKYNNLLSDYNILKNESELKYNNLLNDYNTLKNEPNIKYIIITILLIIFYLFYL